MGLKLGYWYRGEITAEQAHAMVRLLHMRALELDFDDVSPIIRLRGAEARQARTPMVYPIRTLPDGREITLDVPALEAAWFSVETQGAEPATFGLATHPSTMRVEGIDVDTGCEGLWTWQDCCKTQYAGMPQEGGPANFLRAHLGLIALLDEVRDFDLELGVNDDGGYWVWRDEERLLDELDRWNGMIASLGKLLVDEFGDTYGPPVGPIFEHPEFETLAEIHRPTPAKGRTPARGRASAKGPAPAKGKAARRRSRHLR